MAGTSQSVRKMLITLGIALVLLSWAAYALSGAGISRPLPLLRPTFVVITVAYLLRGLAGPFFLAGTGRSSRFITILLLLGRIRPAKSSTLHRKAKTWCALKFRWTPVLAF